ncbi:putative phage protein [Staphylococcus equorum subsp. equorum Mu2]|uniref:hypothetical protein n=1 Tax=Staphylococcus equorum TaxID=246432 RepID=UPI000267DEA3|nr:hypothetical protein [Staphylococcus equorum]CCI60784.1 putative phage protein [Staphylococcus equorum subsp. equorum Mu2]
MKKNKRVMPADYQVIYNTIKNSEQEYVTIKQLIASIGRPINENNKRYVRQVIHNLFMKYDKQIGSFRYNNGGGYFIIRTEEDRTKALYTFNSQFASVFSRYNKLKRINLDN